MATGIVKDKRYMEHDMGPFHVESPERIESIYRMIDDKIKFSPSVIEPRLATEEELALISVIQDVLSNVQKFG